MATDRVSSIRIINLTTSEYCVPGFVGGYNNPNTRTFLCTAELDGTQPPSAVGELSSPISEVINGSLLGGFLTPELPFLEGGGIAPDNTANGGPDVIPTDWSATTQSPDPKFPVADIIYSTDATFIARIISAPFNNEFLKLATNRLAVSDAVPVSFASSRIAKPLKIEILTGGGAFNFLDGVQATMFAPLTFGNGVDPVEPFLIVVDSDTTIKITY